MLSLKNDRAQPNVVYREL